MLGNPKFPVWSVVFMTAFTVLPFLLGAFVLGMVAVMGAWQLAARITAL